MEERGEGGAHVLKQRLLCSPWGETRLQQVYPERLQFVDRTCVGEVREVIAAERNCYGMITTPQLLTSLSDGIRVESGME